MSRYPVALVLLALTACASAPKAEPMPTIVRVPVTQYVPVPDKLTKPCPVTKATTRTVEAVVSAYNANVTALGQCNSQLKAIEGLGSP